MTVDQPLYALGKQIQWTKPGNIDDDHFLVMMGDLHIEMTFMKCIGKSFRMLIILSHHHLQFILYKHHYVKQSITYENRWCSAQLFF